jgi:Beta/Gamma crystallin
MKRIATCLAFSTLALAPFAGAAENAPPAAPAATAVEGPLTIVVYDQPNLKGRALTFTQAVPDLAAKKFDDKIASLSITGAGDWVLCEHRNYGGRCARVRGKADDLKLFDVVGRVSSLYPVPATPEPAAATP